MSKNHNKKNKNKKIKLGLKLDPIIERKSEEWKFLGHN